MKYLTTLLKNGQPVEQFQFNTVNAVLFYIAELDVENSIYQGIDIKRFVDDLENGIERAIGFKRKVCNIEFNFDVRVKKI